jgi:hypothetical protein
VPNLPPWTKLSWSRFYHNPVVLIHKVSELGIPLCPGIRTADQSELAVTLTADGSGVFTECHRNLTESFPCGLYPCRERASLAVVARRIVFPQESDGKRSA